MLPSCKSFLPWRAQRLAPALMYLRVVMCITFAIYIRVGVEIYRKGRMLRSLAYQYSGSSSMSKPLSKKSNGSRSTEVRITSEPMNVQVVPHAQIRSDEGMAAKGYDEYTITIEAKGESQDGEPATEQQIPLERRPVLRSHGSSANDSNAAAWGYARCAFFFFLAMLVTWVSGVKDRLRSEDADRDTARPRRASAGSTPWPTRPSSTSR